MPSLDRGTKIYALILVGVAVGLISLALYESPIVSRLNEKLEADTQIAEFPYHFRVLRISNGVAVMNSPRSSAVPVAQVLDKIFPGIGNSDPDSPLFQEMQSQLATVQTKARDLVLKAPEVKRVQWEVDRDWLMSHGITVPDNAL
jgi:hypothetical protein